LITPSHPFKLNLSESDLFNFREALSREFRESLPMELLYAVDLVLMAETEELLVEKIQKWKKVYRRRDSE